MSCEICELCGEDITNEFCDCPTLTEQRDEIARLKAEVERLRESDADLIQTIFDAGQRVGIEPADLSPTEVLTKMADALARHKRALAAGPAALRAKYAGYKGGIVKGAYDQSADLVERAQAEAMEEGT